MTDKIKILHLEDLPSDGEMVDRELKKSGMLFEKVLVESKQAYIKSLLEFSPHIILSDHSLPLFDSQDALNTVKEMGLKMPFILVTATVSEEYAVNIMKAGASDYILKDRLQRLPNAILSALERYNLEEKRIQADAVMRASQKKYKLLFESNPMPMWMILKSSRAIIDVNKAAINHYGYSKEEFLNINAADLVADAPSDQHTDIISEKTDEFRTGIWQLKKKDGSIIFVDIIANEISYENRPTRLILANDISEKLRVEEELERHRTLQQKLITETSIKAQEKEREEIGKELHDNINQILASTKLYLEYSLTEKSEEMLAQLLNKGVSSLDVAIREIRHLSHKLVAPSLENISLTNAIKALVENLGCVTPLKLHFSAFNFDENQIHKDIQLMFYRITQEQINNILKHSKAKNVTIQFSTNEGFTVLTVKDDGVGFDTGKTSHGIGLRNISHRAELYNGSVNVVSAPGKGCTLTVSLPASE